MLFVTICGYAIFIKIDNIMSALHLLLCVLSPLAAVLNRGDLSPISGDIFGCHDRGVSY